ncbi:MAG: ATP-NAD kinase family protein [Candidatus Bathyarchaeota archaeon]|nr:ATP-NAD kinase family protein [Candidatus Bathyarchaeota archaeon]
MTAKAIPTKTLGFIVNPIAGMGGAVGLKGTDGKQILQQALERGAKPIASQRAETFLCELSNAKPHLRLVVGAGEMGEAEAKHQGYSYTVVGQAKTETSAADTASNAKAILEAGVDLLVYCGGDGTTRDIQKAIDLKLPALGVPTGVKMHSALFAISPQAAAGVVIRYLWGGLPIREAEVMDIDEEAFRAGRLSAELYGYMLSPFEPHLIQGNKMQSPITEDEVENQAAIALGVIEEMQPNVLYIVGPGSTTRTVADLLDQKKTLLGVDVFLDKKIVAKDVNETRLLELTHGKPTKIIVTPIGGQGFIFGRGNQQISSRVIRQVGLDNITVIATKSKLDKLKSLRVDTGDSELDCLFKARGVNVVADYKTTQILTVE